MVSVSKPSQFKKLSKYQLPSGILILIIYPSKKFEPWITPATPPAKTPPPHRPKRTMGIATPARSAKNWQGSPGLWGASSDSFCSKKWSNLKTMLIIFETSWFELLRLTTCTTVEVTECGPLLPAWKRSPMPLLHIIWATIEAHQIQVPHSRVWTSLWVRFTTTASLRPRARWAPSKRKEAKLTGLAATLHTIHTSMIYIFDSSSSGPRSMLDMKRAIDRHETTAYA